MTGKRIALVGCGLVAAVSSIFFFGSMLAQTMLGGVSEREVWFDRVVVWLVYFPTAGLLAMASVYLIRRAKQGELPIGNRVGVRRVVLFPLGWLCLAACLYFADFAWYLREYRVAEEGAYQQSNVYLILAVLLLAGSASAFWQGRKLRNAG